MTQKTPVLHRLMTRGHTKVRYKRNTGRLLIQLSDGDHRQIADVIAAWLNSGTTPFDTSKPKRKQ